VYDADYRSSLKDWNSFVEALTEELTKIDDTVPELPLKDVVSIVYGLTIYSKLTHISLNRSFASTETYDSAKILHPTKYVRRLSAARQAELKWPLLSTATLILTH
jgi:hypothetical protein